MVALVSREVIAFHFRKHTCYVDQDVNTCLHIFFSLQEIQTDVCMVDCGRNIWLPGGWTRCRHRSSNKRLACGVTGVRSRTILCMSVLNGQPYEELEPEQCDPLGKPAEMEECQVHCPGECVVSEWSDWTPCQGPGNVTETRNRTRRILRHSTPGITCPHLLFETDVCLEYDWESRGQGSCIVDKDSSCGRGLSKTMLFCIRKSDGLPVDFRYCDQVGEYSPALPSRW